MGSENGYARALRLTSPRSYPTCFPKLMSPARSHGHAFAHALPPYQKSCLLHSSLTFRARWLDLAKARVFSPSLTPFRRPTSHPQIL